MTTASSSLPLFFFLYIKDRSLMNVMHFIISASEENPLSHHWIQGAVPRIRSAFERALSVTSSPMLRFGSQLPCLALTLTSTFWTDHLRVVLWSAYMAFEWALAGGASSISGSDDPNSGNFDAHRKQRDAFKAIFYRAVEDLPWAKVGFANKFIISSSSLRVG